MSEATAPSMQDVAARAGVSMATVSNVINRPEKVRELTRQKVQRAIDDLGFVRNDAARSLAAGSSTTIGLVLVDMGNSFFVDIARGAEAAVREHGMNLLIANSDVDLIKQRDNLDAFDAARVAGILLAPLDIPEAADPKRRAPNRPVVLVNYQSRDGSLSSVLADERRGGHLAASHLLGLGRRRLLFVGGPLDLTAVVQRLEGALAAVREFPDATMEVVTESGLNIRHGQRAAEQLLAAGKHYDGIVAASDLLAVGLIQGFDRTPGWVVPDDVSIIGYDDNHFASESAVPVSSIRQPGEEMGRAAAELLLAEIEGGRAHRGQTVVLEPRLIARRSSAGRADPPA